MTQDAGGWMDPADGAAPHPQPQLPHIPPQRPEHAPAEGVPADPYGGPPDPFLGAPVSGEEWWRWPDPRTETEQAWAEEGHQSREAAWEVGAAIGEAVAAHLPGPPPSPAERGLDLSWMRLKYTAPALLIAVVMAVRGAGPARAFTKSVADDGLFAPLGAVFLVAAVLLALSLLPVGNLFAGLIGSVLRGVGIVLVRAWHARVFGYVLRLLAAVVAWLIIIAVLRVVGRTALNWLTGV
ncbi:hypothetical protein [Streptomyces sp. NPDC089919]|uniref:hypothetical protein n=1 Tax=Streptomyces sp. NPDC089919 TaxID=3155188 RepID=UPI003436612E